MKESWKPVLIATGYSVVVMFISAWLGRVSAFPIAFLALIKSIENHRDILKLQEDVKSIAEETVELMNIFSESNDNVDELLDITKEMIEFEKKGNNSSDFRK